MKNEEATGVREKRLSLAFRFNELRTRKMAVPEWKVLLALAHDGPKTMYELKKILGIAYPAVHKATKCLEQLKWIEIIRREKSEKNVTMMIYGLTKEGLLWMFSRIPVTAASSYFPTVPGPHAKEERLIALRGLKSQKDVELHLPTSFNLKEIAEKNAELFPQVFACWDLYEKIKVTRHLFESLPEAAMSTLCDYHFGSDPQKPICLESLFTYNLYYAFIRSVNTRHALDFPFEDEVRDRAVRIYRENEDSLLRGIIEKVARDLEKELSRELESIRSFANLCDL